MRAHGGYAHIVHTLAHTDTIACAHTHTCMNAQITTCAYAQTCTCTHARSHAGTGLSSRMPRRRLQPLQPREKTALPRSEATPGGACVCLSCTRCSFAQLCSVSRAHSLSCSAHACTCLAGRKRCPLQRPRATPRATCWRRALCPTRSTTARLPTYLQSRLQRCEAACTARAGGPSGSIDGL